VRYAAPAILVLFAAAPPALCATIHVPGDQPTIQAGIDAAVDGDTVLLASGVYTGPGNRDINCFGKAIVVRSESDDPSTCVIDCESVGRGFLFTSGEGLKTVLEGVTVTNGSGQHGGAVYCPNGSPTLRNCVFRSSSADIYGGGIYCRLSSPAITSCLFLENSAGQHGGGIYCQFSSPTLTDCRIIGNWVQIHGGGMMLGDDSHAVVTGCVIAGNGAHNFGGGIAIFGSDPLFTNCTITENFVDFPQNGGGLYVGSSITPRLENTIISFSPLGEAIAIVGPDEPVLVCCDIYGNAGGDWTDEIADNVGVDGNFSADPLYCDPDNGDFTIQSASPCAPPGATGCGLIGALPVGCGPVSVEPETWAGIKARYRRGGP
jgi:predicted outer membrane repeat protein